jgi:DNA-binding response OmpR family regulator
MEGKTLLIIDDEKDICLLLSRLLRKDFEKVEYAHTIEEGKAKAATIEPDTILLDNNLPDGYGINFIRHFKNLFRSARIIMTSAMDIKQDALAAGADWFLEKPIRLHNLVELS